MSSNSRRAFLMGRRTLRTPWENFCRRLSRAVSGTFYEFGVHDGVGSARLTLGQAADVHHARSLCTEYGVVLATDGDGMRVVTGTSVSVRVDSGGRLTRHKNNTQQ